MRKSILTIICFFIFHSLFAQIQFQSWYDNLGDDNGIAICPTSDGGYAVLGRNTINNIYFATLMKTDSLGNTLWVKKFPDTYYAFVNTFQQTNDGGFIFGGITTGASTGKTFLTKTDAGGAVEWSKYYSGYPTSNQRIYSVKQTWDGGYIATGIAQGSGNMTFYHLLKLDTSGNVQWTKDYDMGICAFDYNDIHFDVQVCDNKNEGYVIGTSKMDGFNADKAVLIKTDSTGNLQWGKYYDVNGSSSDLFLLGYSVIQSSEGGFILMGYNYDGRNKIFLMKVTNSGVLEWARKLWINEYSAGLSIKKTFNEEFVICGLAWTQSNANKKMYVIKFDAAGTIEWSKIYGDSLNEEGYNISPTNDNGYIISGFSTSFGSMNSNIYLVKTDAAGVSNCNENDVITNDVDITPYVTTINITGTSSLITNAIDTLIFVDSYNTFDSTICNTVGVFELTDVAANTISLFPNPATDELRIENAELKIKEIEIYSSIGEKIYARQPETSNQQHVTISVADFPPGIYFITVTDQAGNKVTRKVVKL